MRGYREGNSRTPRPDGRPVHVLAGSAVVLLAALAVGALAVASGVSARTAQSGAVKVWFLHGEQMEAVSRPGTSAGDAIAQLLAGPTAAEGKRGTRTYVPKGTRARSVTVARGEARAVADYGRKAARDVPRRGHCRPHQVAKWWSVPFREWLLWAVPFNGGIAFHEFPEVPAYAASHGCVRECHTNARWLYDFSEVGMPVKVISRS